MTIAAGVVPRDLPERPPISAPDHPAGPADVVARQPRTGLIGLVLVVPIAAALALGAGGADSSVLILGPLVTYSLPLVAMVAFWWEDWPGTRLPSSWSGWANTLLIAGGAILLTGVGQIVVADLDLSAMFDPSPGPGHVPTFPATMPLAGAAFVAMLQLTLVGEGWPLRRVPRLAAGPLALAVSWAVALAVYFALADVRGRLGTMLLLIGGWQALFYVAWRGWPFSAIATRWRRLTCAHVAVIAGGILTYVVVHDVLAVESAAVAAWAGCFVAAAVLFGMLLEGWLDRVTTLLAALALTALLAVALHAAADGMRFTRSSAHEWVVHASLNAMAVSIILHVAIGRRWPFARRPPAGQA
jgi:hypothetical protein